MADPPLAQKRPVRGICEWARPRGQSVNRRHAAYGSPSPEAAGEAVKGGTAYRVEFLGEHTICQLDIPDAKELVDEIGDIKKAVLQLLGNHHQENYYAWCTDDLKVKQIGGRLYMPCLSRDDVEAVLDDIGATDEERRNLRSAVSYWDRLTVVGDGEPLPDPDGEIVFSYEGGYTLHQIGD